MPQPPLPPSRLPSQPLNPQPIPLLSLEPVPTLLKRIHEELSADFEPRRPTRVGRAPGRLDVMGGVAGDTGSLVCAMPPDRAAAVAIQERADRILQVFSFNLFDEHLPFTLRIPLEALATQPADALRRDFSEPGREWAGYLAGCLFVLHEQQYIDLSDPAIKGLNLALFSTVPIGAGVASSAAIEAATLMALVDHFALRDPQDERSLDSMHLAELCQQVENRIVGIPGNMIDAVTSISGQAGTLLRLLCQPHQIQPPLHFPAGIRVLGINSGVRHSVAGGLYGKTRCAAFMGHRMILEKMRQMGAAAGRTLRADPMNGYLANLDADDYKSLFRPYLPQSIRGREFLEQFGPTIDKAATVDPDIDYHVQSATDHHVLEARRVRQFIQFIEEAARFPHGTRDQGAPLDKAGHLMYASHLSYTNNTLLGAHECDLLVDLVRKHEPAGLYGARITARGSGGTVAVLADISDQADQAIAQTMAEYEKQTGHSPELLQGSSPGAWDVGTAVV